MKNEPRYVYYNPEPLWIARRRRKMSQTEAAERCGVARITIVRAERGSPKVSPETLQTYAKLLGVPYSALGYSVTGVPSETSVTHSPPV